MPIPRPATRLWEILVRTYSIFSEIDVEQRAASFAYYAAFSLIPLIALLLSTGSMLFNPESVRAILQEFIPPGTPGQEILWQMVADLQLARGSVSLVSILILAWSSLRFFQALVRAVNRAWHTEELPWWQMPLKNLAMVGILTSGLVLGILLPALVQAVVHALQAFEDFIEFHVPGLHIGALAVVIQLSRYVVGGVVLLYTIFMLYTFAPRKRPPLRYVWLPALLTTLSLQGLQIAVVNYLPLFINYNVVYGPIGGVMIFLFWIYLTGFLIILGGCFSAALGREESASEPATPSPPACREA